MFKIRRAATPQFCILIFKLSRTSGSPLALLRHLLGQTTAGPVQARHGIAEGEAGFELYQTNCYCQEKSNYFAKILTLLCLPLFNLLQGHPERSRRGALWRKSLLFLRLCRIPSKRNVFYYLEIACWPPYWLIQCRNVQPTFKIRL